MRPLSWAASARLAKVAALPTALAAVTALAALTAVTACGPGSPPPPAHQQAQADPTAVPPDPSAATPGAAPPAAPVSKPPAPAEAASPASVTTPPAVAPAADDELRRKRAEWQELQRMQEQARAKVEAWERSRQSTRPALVPHVGDAPVDETQAEAERTASAMRAWYRRYSGRSAAVTLALSQYGTASSAQPLNPSLLRDSCGKLLAASTALVDDPRALPAPLHDVSAALSTAYAEIKETAQACLANRDEDRAAHLAAALRAMAAAGTALRPYGMTP